MASKRPFQLRTAQGGGFTIGWSSYGSAESRDKAAQKLWLANRPYYSLDSDWRVEIRDSPDEPWRPWKEMTK